MIRLYPEQLATQLREGLCACYLLSGNEPLMLQESQDLIRQAAQQQQFSEHHSISLDAHTDWDAIFSICQAMSLFASRQTLLLMFPENGPTAPIGDQLIKLSALLHNDILLILRGPRLTKAQENSAWFKSLSPKAVCVSCQAPEQMQLPRWVAARAKLMKLELDNAANQLLCYCYEGNLLALSQALERLSLLHLTANSPYRASSRQLTMPPTLHRSIGWMPYWQARANALGIFCNSCSRRMSN